VSRLSFGAMLRSITATPPPLEQANDDADRRPTLDDMEHALTDARNRVIDKAGDAKRAATAYNTAVDDYEQAEQQIVDRLKELGICNATLPKRFPRIELDDGP